MLKVLVAALVGTVIGVAVMVTRDRDRRHRYGGCHQRRPRLAAALHADAGQHRGAQQRPVLSPTSSPTSSGGSGDVAAGKTVFDANCASCHSAVAGTPSPLPAAPNLAELAPTLDTETILNQIENGGGPMPAGLVSGADADNVAAYILSLGQ